MEGASMDGFEKEVSEAFLEVSTTGMPIPFRLTNENYKGVVQSTTSMMHLREPGYESENEIIVYAPGIQFANDPSEYVREILQVDAGPQQGQWVVQSVNTDLAHYIFSCRPSDL
jgi:hypothetical protein